LQFFVDCDTVPPDSTPPLADWHCFRSKQNPTIPMARIFTIRFTYEDNFHHAMVFVKETPFFTEYKLNMLEYDLLKLLPSDKVISSTTDHFTFWNYDGQEYSDLMKEIIRAISEHIHSVHT
jgi:hypothetical protein